MKLDTNKPIAFFFLMVLLYVVPLNAGARSDSLTYFGSVVGRFEQYLANGLEEMEIPGAAVAVVRDGKVIYLKAFGVRQVGQPDPVDIHTVFRLSSLSKAFASTLTGVLIQDGKLDWDDQVITYLQDFALNDSSQTRLLTIRNILSQTTGLPSHAYTNLIEDDVPYQTILKRLADVPLECEVGECFSYQNVVYSLIGDIIEKVTGQSYSDALKHKLLFPLGMYDASSTYRAMVSTENHAWPHVRARNKWHPVDVEKAYYSVKPAAGVNASISDMAIWLQAQMGAMPEVISPKTLGELHKRAAWTNKRKRYFGRWPRLRVSYYGLGWRVLRYADLEIVYHGGYVRGFRSEIAFCPEERIGIVVLMNSANSLIGRCVPTFFDYYLAFRNSETSP